MTTKSPKFITVTGVSFSAYAQEQPLLWPTPMRELLKNPDAGDFVWRRLGYIFRQPDPRTFSATVPGLTADERAVLELFVEHPRDLAGTTLLTASKDRYTVHVADDNTGFTVETELSDSDVSAGFMVKLRQSYANDQEASFSKVRKILEHRLHEAGDEAAVALLKQWRKAHAALRNKTTEELVQEQMVADGQLPKELVGPDGETRSPVVRSPESPHQMLQTFWCGRQVHWGKSRQALGVIQADPYQSGRWEVEARQAAVDLGHFYLGFSLLVESALGHVELVPQ